MGDELPRGGRILPTVPDDGFDEVCSGRPDVPKGRICHRKFLMSQSGRGGDFDCVGSGLYGTGAFGLFCRAALHAAALHLALLLESLWYMERLNFLTELFGHQSITHQLIFHLAE